MRAASMSLCTIGAYYWLYISKIDGKQNSGDKEFVFRDIADFGQTYYIEYGGRKWVKFFEQHRSDKY